MVNTTGRDTSLTHALDGCIFQQSVIRPVLGPSSSGTLTEQYRESRNRESRAHCSCSDLLLGHLGGLDRSSIGNSGRRPGGGGASKRRAPRVLVLPDGRYEALGAKLPCQVSAFPWDGSRAPLLTIKIKTKMTLSVIHPSQANAMTARPREQKLTSQNDDVRPVFDNAAAPPKRAR